MWLIHRNGTQYGPADEATVRGWIAEGRVTSDDLAWQDGMTQWLRIASLAAFANVTVPAGVPAPPAVMPTGAPGSPLPITAYPGSLGAFGAAGYQPEHTVPATTPVWPGAAPYGVPLPPAGYVAGAPSQVPARPEAWQAALLPVGRSGYAIGAGYCALLGIVVFPLAIVGLILAIVALREIKAKPHLLGRGRAIFALIVGGLWSAYLLYAIVHAATR